MLKTDPEKESETGLILECAKNSCKWIRKDRKPHLKKRTKGVKRRFTEEEAQMVTWCQEGYSSSLVISTAQITSDAAACPS